MTITITNVRTRESLDTTETPRAAVALAWAKDLGHPSPIVSPWAPLRFATDYTNRKLAVLCGDWVADLVTDPYELIDESIRLVALSDRKAARVVVENRRQRRTARAGWLKRYEARKATALASVRDYNLGLVAGTV